VASVLDLHVETFTRDGVDILRDIRWQVKPGEHWAVLGANGAGKSSLLSIVAGYEWPSRGRVAVLGETYGKCDMRALKERIGAYAFRNKRYGVLSQGEKQRVMIARALVTNPDLLILDDPCAGLDPGARERLIKDVDRLCATSNGPTLILVSHHVEEIPAQGTHGLLLKDGRVLAAGRLNEVLTDQLLSELYDYPCKVGSSNDRYWLHGH